MSADVTAAAEISADVARYRAERHAEYSAEDLRVRALIQDENAALEARAAVAELQWRHAARSPWIDRFEDLQQKFAVQNAQWAAEHNCDVPANPVTTNTLVKLAESDRRRKAEAESLIARAEECLDASTPRRERWLALAAEFAAAKEPVFARRLRAALGITADHPGQHLVDVRNAQFQGAQGVDDADQDVSNVVGIGLSPLGVEYPSDVGDQLVGNGGRVTGLAAAEVERVSEGHDSSPSSVGSTPSVGDEGAASGDTGAAHPEGGAR